MKILWQILVILAITVCISLGYNHFRSKPLPLLYSWSESVTESVISQHDAPIVSLEEAATLFKAGHAVFIDARPESSYDQGHIQGALCLPWHQAEEKFIEVVEKIPPEKEIITYCDGVTCDLSDKLALFLSNLGFENVRALVNGWTVWNEHKLPVDLPQNHNKKEYDIQTSGNSL